MTSRIIIPNKITPMRADSVPPAMTLPERPPLEADEDSTVVAAKVVVKVVRIDIVVDPVAAMV